MLDTSSFGHFISSRARKFLSLVLSHVVYFLATILHISMKPCYRETGDFLLASPLNHPGFSSWENSTWFRCELLCPYRCDNYNDRYIRTIMCYFSQLINQSICLSISRTITMLANTKTEHAADKILWIRKRLQRRSQHYMNIKSIKCKQSSSHDKCSRRAFFNNFPDCNHVSKVNCSVLLQIVRT